MKNIKLTSLGWTYLTVTILLTVVGGFLKYLKIIDWSWWLITAPVWGSFVFALLFLLVCWAIVKLWRNDKNGNDETIK